MKKLIVLLMVMVLTIAVMSSTTAPFALADSTQATEQATPVAIDLTAIINALILVLAAFVTGKVIPYIKSKLSAAQYAQFEAAVRVGVFAAEEIYRSGHGDEKLEYVKGYLKKKGYNVDIDQIKATVYQMRESGVVVNVEAAEGQVGAVPAGDAADKEEDEDPQT